MKRDTTVLWCILVKVTIFLHIHTWWFRLEEITDRKQIIFCVEYIPTLWVDYQYRTCKRHPIVQDEKECIVFLFLLVFDLTHADRIFQLTKIGIVTSNMLSKLIASRRHPVEIRFFVDVYCRKHISSIPYSKCLMIFFLVSNVYSKYQKKRENTSDLL